MNKCLLSISTLLLSVYTHAESDTRPNIIFLLSDDQRWDSQACYGNTTVKTPEIDRLAAEGVRFRNSFVTFSVSTASRAVILTGRYSRSRSNGEDDLAAIVTPTNWDNTFPSILNQNGYYTGYIGKWDIGAGEDGFQQGIKMFDYWGGDRFHGNYWHESNCNFVTNDGTLHKNEIRCTCVAGTAQESSLPRTGHTGMSNPIHTDTEVVPLKVSSFMASRDKEKPFFLQVSFRSPKDPWSDYPNEVSDFYSNNNIPLSNTATMQDAMQQPEFLQNSMGSSHARSLIQSGNLQNEIRKHLRLVTGIDMAIGKIKKILEEEGIAENTIIVFASDNGAFLGEHGFWGKWLPYEESIRVPLIIYDPTLDATKRGKVVDKMVLNVDYAPTFLSYAGLQKPNYMQGADVRPLIMNPDTNWRSDWYYEHSWTAATATTSIVPSEAVRTSEWKYILFPKQQVEQLFNLKQDSIEMVNLANDPSQKSVLDNLRQRLAYYRDLYKKETQTSWYFTTGLEGWGSYGGDLTLSNDGAGSLALSYATPRDGTNNYTAIYNDMPLDIANIQYFHIKFTATNCPKSSVLVNIAFEIGTNTYYANQTVNLADGELSFNIRSQVQNAWNLLPTSGITKRIRIEIPHSSELSGSDWNTASLKIDKIAFTNTILSSAPDFDFEENELVLYPNPVTTSFDIMGQKYNKVTVLDFSGKVVKKFVRADAPFSINTLANGVYYVKIELSDKSTVVKKFVKGS